MRTMPWLVSRISLTWAGSKGSVKLGQPVPDSNLLPDRKAAQAAGIEAALLVVQQSAAKGPLGAVVEDDFTFLCGEIAGEHVALRIREGKDVVSARALQIGRAHV